MKRYILCSKILFTYITQLLPEARNIGTTQDIPVYILLQLLFAAYFLE